MRLQDTTTGPGNRRLRDRVCVKRRGSWMPLSRHGDRVIASINVVAFSPDGKALSSASNYMTVCLWNATTGAWKRTVEGHRGRVCAVAFSLDGKIFASDGVALGFHYWRGTDAQRIKTHKSVIFRGWSISKVGM